MKTKLYDKETGRIERVFNVKNVDEYIARIDEILKRKKMTQRDLAREMGRSEAVISRWTNGFPNLTLRSIAEISAVLGEPLIKVTTERESCNKYIRRDQ